LAYSETSRVTGIDVVRSIREKKSNTDNGRRQVRVLVQMGSGLGLLGGRLLEQSEKKKKNEQAAIESEEASSTHGGLQFIRLMKYSWLICAM